MPPAAPTPADPVLGELLIPGEEQAAAAKVMLSAKAAFIIERIPEIPLACSAQRELKAIPHRRFRFKGRVRWHHLFNFGSTPLELVSHQPIDAAPRNPQVLGSRRRPIVAVSRLISAASMLGVRPLYIPASLALAMPSRCRSSMTSRSQGATLAKMVSMS